MSPVSFGFTLGKFINSRVHTQNLIRMAGNKFNIIKIFNRKPLNQGKTRKGIFNAFTGSGSAYYLFSVA